MDLLAKGVVVVSRRPATRYAGNYGFQPGDIVRSVNGAAINRVGDLARALDGANGTGTGDRARRPAQLTLSVDG